MSLLIQFFILICSKTKFYENSLFVPNPNKDCIFYYTSESCLLIKRAGLHFGVVGRTWYLNKRYLRAMTYCVWEMVMLFEFVKGKKELLSAEKTFLKNKIP